MNLSSFLASPVWGELTKRAWPLRALVLAVGLMVLPVAGFVLHGRAVGEQITQAQARHDRLQAQWLRGSEQVRLRDVLEAEIRQLQAGLEQRRRELFDDDGLASLLQNLARLGDGLSFERVTVLESRARPHYLELPVQVQITGDYLALQLFLARFARLGRLVTVQQLLLTRPDEHAPGPLHLQLQLQAYRAVVSSTAVQPAIAASVAARDPFATDEVVVPDAALPGQATMVGHLRGQQGQVALIRAGEVVYPLREGDVFGRERVMVIDEGRVELMAVEGEGPLPRVLRLVPFVEGQDKEVR